MDYKKQYYILIERLKELGRPTGLFNELNIRKHYTNERISSKGWLYNRHHICEIDISGSGIMRSSFANTESIIVDVVEHSLLHYLIVLAGTTAPNYGMTLQFDNGVKDWDEYIKLGCEKYNIEYVEDWQKKLK